MQRKKLFDRLEEFLFKICLYRSFDFMVEYRITMVALITFLPIFGNLLHLVHLGNGMGVYANKLCSFLVIYSYSTQKSALIGHIMRIAMQQLIVYKIVFK